MLLKASPTPHDDNKLLKWHSKQINTEDPNLLKQHSEKLIKQLLITEEALYSNVYTIKSAIKAFFYTSFITFSFCTAAFVYAKNKKIEPAASGQRR